MAPAISPHFQSRQPSAIRLAQVLFGERPDKEHITVVNVAIGNVSLPMHPLLWERVVTLRDAKPFAGGIVKYSASIGFEETQAAFLRVIAAAGADTSGLFCIVTDGGSVAMELMVLGTAGPACKRPLLLIDPAYSNYTDICRRLAVPTATVQRVMNKDGAIAPFDLDAIERVIREQQPKALVVIPADNPTGQFVSQDELTALARLSVRHDLWLVSDEAYRQLHYVPGGPSSVWRITEEQAPGISGRRISIESASKVWNACGLRIGALVTDSEEFHRRALAEYTANLCANVLGQYVFGALAHVSDAELHAWFFAQRAYYKDMMETVSTSLRRKFPGIVVSKPEAALYSVIDVGTLVPARFDAVAFVKFCAQRGAVALDGRDHTLFVAPMAGFYRDPALGRTQMRIAYVEPAAQMAKVPELLSQLLAMFLEQE